MLPITVNAAFGIHPDVPTMSGTVQLDVVRHGLVHVEEFPVAGLASPIGTEPAVAKAAEVIAVDRLDGEPSSTLRVLLHGDFEFLPGHRFLVLEGDDVMVLVSLEPPSFVVNI